MHLITYNSAVDDEEKKNTSIFRSVETFTAIKKAEVEAFENFCIKYSFIVM